MINIQGNLYGASDYNFSSSRGSRADFAKIITTVPKHIQTQLRDSTLRLADKSVYDIQPIKSQTIKLFQSQQAKEVGMRNVTQSKLPQNQVLMVSGIYLLAGVPVTAGATPTQEEIKATHFQTIEQPAYAALQNGEFTLRANMVTLVPSTSMRAFCTANNTNISTGYYKLDNPRLIADNLEFEFEVTLGTMQGLPANSFIYVALSGTITTP